MSDEFDLDQMADEGTIKYIADILVDMRKRYGFTSLRLIGTRPKGNETQHVSVGVGDFFAGIGACRMWLLEEEAKKRPQVVVK